MKIVKRIREKKYSYKYKMADFATNFTRPFRLLFYCIRCLFILKKPLSLIYYYILRRSPKNSIIELRNGFKIHMSGHAHDVITIFVVLAKRDYGKIKKGSVVVDIGANIGVFSLYAAYCGAKKIYAYEPNKEAYEILQRNILNNGLEDTIISHRCAVFSADNQIVKIPVGSSPYNKVLTKDDTEQFELVNTITLKTILSDNAIDIVDLLKIDCEGAEYEIFFSSSSAILSRINEVRMEYHEGPLGELFAYFKDHRFHLNCLKSESAILCVSKI